MTHKPSRVFDFYPLEDRVLLSGEGMDGAELSVDPDAEITASLMAEADAQATEDPAVAAALVAPAPGNEETDTNDFADAPVFDPALPLEVVFVDSGVEDAETLLEGLRGGGNDHTQWLVVELSADEDGVEQISHALSELSGVDAIHILSHGDGQGIQLGNTRLDVDTADGYAGEIASWADSLDAGADLLIYGCDLASTAEGRDLIDSISALCDCDVAASDDATGADDRGGDWILEYAVGDIDTSVAFNIGAQANWGGLLSIVTVTQTDDVVNGSITSVADLIANDGGDGISLREAILATNADLGVADTINIAAGTYTLSFGASGEDLAATGDLDILDDLTITGAGTGLTFIDGGAIDRVFDVQSGTVTFSDMTIQNGLVGAGLNGGGIAIASGANVTINTVELTGNAATGGSNSGGAVYNAGTVTLVDSSLTNNAAGDGGGLYNSGTAIVTGSLFEGNSATTSGGGINNLFSGNLTLTNVTISGNESVGNGGGIYTDGTVTATNITVTDNESTGFSAGGVRVAAGTFNLANSIVAGNYASTTTVDFLGTAVSGGYNIIGDTTGASGFGGTDQLNVDPLLDVLLDNGGPTKTHALLAPSTAIDPAGLTGAPGTDQRGTARDGTPDIGAYEYVAGGPNIVVVTNTNDSINGTVTSIDALLLNDGGDGISLREAITAANNTANIGTADEIHFNFYGAGPHVINVATALPIISQAVIIDASSEPDYAGTPVVRIDGLATGGSVDGLAFSSTSDGSTVRGLMITRFARYGIQINSGADNLTIADNWIGTTGTGSSGVGNDNTGINVQGAGTIIDGNVITNNSNEGINLTGTGATGTIIQGNIIGLDSDGATGGGNSDVGIAVLSGAHNTTITGNVISMNFEGIEINSNNNTVQGNYIGTDITGTLDRGNRSDDGVEVQNSATGNLIGGRNAGEGNIIAFNALDGVHIASGTGSVVVGNSIHSNGNLGIDIGANGVTANDIGVQDSDSGANNLQNFPVITNAVTTGSEVTISGYLDTADATSYTLDFYATGTVDVSGYGEAQTYLGSVDVETDGSGYVNFNFHTTFSLGAGQSVTATATNTFDGTSELGANFATTSAQNVLWLSTDATVGSPGADGLPNGWREGEALQFGGTDLSLGAATDGDFASVIDFDRFVSGTSDPGALHYVTRDVTVGSGEDRVDLRVGDVLVSFNQAETILAQYYETGVATLVGQDDLLVFRPDEAGSYDSGTFYMLLNGIPDTLAAPITNLNGISLVEYDTMVGATLLQAGTFIFAEQAGVDPTDIYHYDPTVAGKAVSVGTTTLLIDGSDIGINQNVRGLELIESTITVGGVVLNTGEILVTLAADDASVGDTPAISTAVQDIFVLSVTDAEPDTGVTAATATMLLDGSDVNLDGSERIYAIALAPVNVRTHAQDDRVGLSFDGDDYVFVADDPSLVMTNNVTMEAWINHSGNGTGSQLIVNKEGEYELGITADTGEVKWAIANSVPSWSWHNTGYFITAGEWTHLAVTYDGIAGEVKTYVNGALVDTFSQSGAIGDVYTSDNDLHIGARQNTTLNRFDGQIDEVRVWNLTRTEGEIKDNKDALLTGAESGLVGNWRFDEGSGTIAFDQSTSGNDAALGGGAAQPTRAGYSIDEDSVLDTTLLVLPGVLANDLDAEGDSLTATNLDTSGTLGLVTLNADGSFVYDPNGQFESLGAGEYAIDTFTYTANDGTGDSNVATVTITILGVNDNLGAVTDTNAAANSVAENASVGTVVGITAEATDVDTSDSVSYSLLDDDGGRFAINSSTGVVTVNGAIDREADGASRNITVRATSSDTSFTDQVFAIAINDVDEFNVGMVIDGNGSSNSVDENAANGTAVGITVLASDADATNNTITYTLDDNAGGRFAINSSTGVVTVADGTLLDREAAANHLITVRASSSDGSFNTAVMGINVNDVDEFDVGAVTDSDATANAVNENATVGTVVGITGSGSDADATTNTMTYSLFDDDGGRFTIDGNSGVVTVAGAIDREADGASRNITVRATSSDLSFTDQVFAIAINPVNDNTPVVTSDGGGATAAVNVLENSSYVSTVTATDGDLPGDTLTYSITGGVDSAKFSIDSSSGVLTFVAGPDYESATDIGGNNVYDVIVRVSDGTLFDTQAIAVTVTDVADSGQYLDLFDSASYSNSDGSQAWTNGWVESEGDGPGSGQIKISSSELKVDASVLNNIYREVDLSSAASAMFDFSYKNTLTGAQTILVQVSGNGGASYTTLEVMDSSTNTGNGTKSIDISSYMAADTRIRILVSAAGTSEVVTFDNVQVSYTPNSAPTITSDGAGASASVNVMENSTGVTTVTAVDGDLPAQTLVYSIIGGADSTKFNIDSSSGVLTFIAAPNYESATDIGGNNVYDVTVQVSDGITVDTQAIAVTVTDFDEFDVGIVADVDAGSNAVTENATVGTTVGITASASDNDGTTNAITYSLQDDDGGRFTVDSNSGVVTVSGAIDRETDGASRNITVRATSADGSFTDHVFAIAINDVDEFDVGAVTDSDATANAVNENATVGTVVGITGSGSDADATTNEITYTLQDNDGGRFAIDASTGIVTVAGAIDREADGASRNITVRATSADGSFTDQVYAIAINDVDEFDVGVVSDTDATANAVNENATVGTVVGVTGSASDADSTTNAITYSLFDSDGGRFAIDSSSGVVTVAGAIDREADGASRNITVRATSADGSFTDQVMAININDVDEFDVGAVTDSDATANAVNENATVGTVVGITGSGSDADATTNAITYSLFDNDGGRFAIDGNSGVVTVAGTIDREADGTSRNITVRATSADGSFTDQVMAININDVDEFDVGTVTDTDATANAVDENVIVGTTVGITASAADADATTNAMTYSLFDNDGGRFTIDGNSGIVTVAGAIDREADGASRNITVRATSADGSFTDQVMAININDVDEFDVGAVTDSDATANAVNENATVGTVVGITGSGSDADATTNAINYTLQDNDGGRFAIDSSSGIVTVAGAIDREADGASRNITVRATSADGSFTDQVMAININDVDEFDVGTVTDSDATANAVNENATVGTVVGITGSASDTDATTNAITYSLFDNDGGRFAIDSSSGIVTVAGAIDREADGASRNITVRATSADGSFSDQVMAININDVDEVDVGAISDGDGTTNAVDENAVFGTTVGITASASDTDATTNAISYSLFSDDGGRFTIDSASGVVTVAGAIDREADGASRNITVRATSADGSFTDQVMAININDVDEFDVGVVTDTNATANAVNENATVGTVVGITGSGSDADATTNAITYTLQDNDGGRFAIDSSSGVVTVAGAIDREADGASRNITVRATSADGSFTDQVLAININDVDEFDVGAVSDGDGTTNAVDENAVFGTTVGISASASDADATTNAISYSLFDDDGGRFTIDSASGVVTVAGAIDREADGASRNITVRATSADGSFSDQVLAISINDVDEFDVGAVSDSDGTVNAVDENAIVGTTVGITVSASDADATTNAINYSLFSDDGGRFTIDSASGVVTVAGAIDREADGATRNITVRATSADGSFTDQVLAININDVDEFDVGAITDSDGAVDDVAENAGIGTSVGITALATDADATSNSIAYTLDDDAGGRFAIDGATGEITVNGALDFETNTSHNVIVRAASSDGSSGTQSFTINVTDVSESGITPMVDSDGSADTVLENAIVGTTVGVTTFSDDPDAGDTVTYGLDDNDGGRFVIDTNTGVVTVAGAIDREADGASRNITVRATSTDGSFTLRSFTISVGDVDEFDVGSISDSDVTIDAVNENASNGTLVGVTALASDADATNNTMTYTLDDDAGGRFAIDGVTGVVTVADGTLLNREAAANHNIIVRATSSDGSFNASGMTINVNDVDEFDVGTVSDGDVTVNAVDENAIVGTTVGITASASDTDATTNAISYSLFNDDGGRFTIDSASGVVTVAGAIDREADGATRNITVRATSADGSFTDQVLAININDVDEFDVGVVSDSDGTVNAVDENAIVSTTVGITASASDTDATTNAISYSLFNDDGGRFTIDSASGVVTVAGAIDREADGPSRNITVRATSADGSFTDQVLAININDVDEVDVGAVSDGDGTTNAVDENAVFGTTVGISASASDADATTNAISYSLFDDDGGRFTIDSASGVVTVAGAIDREADGASRNITVRATSADGSFSDQVLAISINDVDEFDVGAVSDSDGTVNAVDENAVVGTTVGMTASASDADATTNAINYSLFNDDGGRFTIDSASGVVTVAGAIDREADGATRNITVRATSADGSFTDQVLAININDVDEFDVGAITDSDGAVDDVAENAGIGTSVGITALATDADATSNSIAYTLDDDAGGRFAIDGVTGEITVNGALDFETNTSHNVIVRAASSDGSSGTQSFTINVTDVSESGITPMVDSDGSADTVLENAIVGTTVGVTTFSDDPDAGDTVTYGLDDNDGGRFAIDTNTGVVTVAGAIDREADGASRNITVRATSTDGSFTLRSFTISLGDVDEFDVSPLIDNDTGANFVNENSALGTIVGVTAFADDGDATDSVNYSLDDSDGGRFAIDSLSGVVTVSGAIDFEASASHNVTVRATSTDGSAATQVFTINVGDVNEAPTAAGDDYSVSSGGTLSVSLPGVIVNDNDVDGDSLTTILVTGPTNGTLTLLAGGNLTYTPDASFFGSDSFFYRVTDGVLQSNIVEVEINVLGGLPVPDADPDPEPEPEPEPEPDPEPEPEPESDPEPDPEPEEDPLDDPAAETTQTNIVPAVTGQGFLRAGPFPTSSDAADGMMEQEDELSIRDAFLGLFSDDSLEFVSRQYSPQVEMLERLLQLDMEKAIVWQLWDQTREHADESPMTFVIGSAGSAVGVFSIGYVVWALRGGAFVTAMSSALPAWRIVDPTALLTAYRTARSPSDAVENMLG